MDNQKLQASHNISQPPFFLQESDEIDLRELFIALWKGKVTILATTVLFAIGAVIYALNAQEWWTSKAVVSQPQLSDYSNYSNQVKQFQPIFDVYQEDGTVLVSESLDILTDPEQLFNQFIAEFNSTNNKKRFLDSSDEFQSYKAKLDTDTDTDTDTDETRRLYADWFEKISATKIDKKEDSSPYELSLQATTKMSSFSLVNEYIAIIHKKTLNDAIGNLQASIDSKQNELLQQKRILEAQAKNRLHTEIERAQYSLAIAKAANVSQPIQTNNNESLFAIDLGFKAIEAKIEALKSISNLDVIEPRLQQISAKLDMLTSLKVNSDIQFSTFRFLEDVQQPIGRDKPKRALIAVLGTLLGGMLGVAIVLVRFAFRKEGEHEG